MARTIHCAVSVDIDRFSDTKLRKEWLPLFRSNGIATVEGIRQACRDMRAKGYEVFPSRACDHHMPDGTCAGHCDNAKDMLAEIVAELALYRFHWAKERDLQDGIEKALLGLAGRRDGWRGIDAIDPSEGVLPGSFGPMEVKREARLGRDAGTVDFVVKIDGVRVGIEVKVKGSFAEVARQLFRYAESCEVDALLLVSTRSKHASELPAVIQGVPVASHLVGLLR